MTDLVAQLVGVLERVDAEWSSFWPLGPDVPSSSDRACAIAPETAEIWRAIRAALSDAKDGGWVAVPVEPTREMVDAMAKAAHDTDEPANKFYRVLYAAMLAARPLPNPPKEQNT